MKDIHWQYSSFLENVEGLSSAALMFSLIMQTMIHLDSAFEALQLKYFTWHQNWFNRSRRSVTGCCPFEKQLEASEFGEIPSMYEYY